MSFYPLEKLNRLYDGYQQPFSVAGRQLLLIQTEGRLSLIENRCPHMDVSLTAAVQLPGGMIRCRAHGIEFDLVSGKAQGPLGDTIECLKHFTLVYDGNQVGVEL